MLYTPIELALLLLLHKKQSNSFAGSSICSNLFTIEFSMCCQLFFSCYACVCCSPLSLTETNFKKESSDPSNQAPVPSSRHSSCALIIHVCLCVCAYICACVTVQRKWSISTNISKTVTTSRAMSKDFLYKTKPINWHTHIPCEIELDVHSDVKQIVKWQVFRHVTEYNTNR